MKKLMVALMLVLLACGAYAETFDVGGVGIAIPAPQGFVLVTPELQELYGLSLRVRDPQSDRLAYFISEADLELARRDETPALDRSFVAKVNLQFRDMVVGLDDFAELKETAKRDNGEILAAIKAKMADRDGNFDLEAAIQATNLLPLSAHYETDAALAYSMYVNYGLGGGNVREDLIATGTVTYVDVAGKILFLYCFGPRDGLEWTRSVSRTWADQILADNPPAPSRSPGDGGGGGDWTGRKVVIGGVICGLIVLVVGVVLVSRKRRPVPKA